MNLAEIAEELEHLHQMKHTFTRRLRARQLQKAAKGTDCPPDILMDIEDTEVELIKINKEIESKEQLIHEIGERISSNINKVTQIAQEPIDQMIDRLSELRSSIDGAIEMLKNLRK